MPHVRQENLPFVGSSYWFVGAEQGDTNVSVFLFQGKPGSGRGPHRHPYDEIQFIREGQGVWDGVPGQRKWGSLADVAHHSDSDTRTTRLDFQLWNPVRGPTINPSTQCLPFKLKSLRKSL
jgi:hypothetical protein